jgi:GTP-sensing pleiotropic transcriptional regulator CodY
MRKTYKLYSTIFRRNKNSRTNKKNHTKNVIECSLDFLNNLKLFHWNTHSYSEHMASDELFEDLVKKTDKLVESLLQNRVPIKTSITLNTDKKSFMNKLISFKKMMKTVTLPEELYSLRDEILIDMDQFEYRLTLH